MDKRTERPTRPVVRPARRPTTRIRNAEARAEQTLADFGVDTMPVPVERVAHHLGLQVERAALGDDVSGILVVQDGRGMIGVNASQAPNRQRFSIAHEIGHFVLHKGAMPVFIDKQFFRPYLAVFRDANSSTGEDWREREANAFAAALLMPAGMLGDAIREMHLDVADDDAIEELAKRFKVSRQAMSFRVANLSLHDA